MTLAFVIFYEANVAGPKHFHRTAVSADLEFELAAEHDDEVRRLLSVPVTERIG